MASARAPSAVRRGELHADANSIGPTPTSGSPNSLPGNGARGGPAFGLAVRCTQPGVRTDVNGSEGGGGAEASRSASGGQPGPDDQDRSSDVLELFFDLVFVFAMSQPRI